MWDVNLKATNRTNRDSWTWTIDQWFTRGRWGKKGSNMWQQKEI